MKQTQNIHVSLILNRLTQTQTKKRKKNVQNLKKKFKIFIRILNSTFQNPIPPLNSKP